MTWRASKVPILKVKENWRNTMTEDETPMVEKAKLEVLNLINQKIKELKPQLKNELKQVLRNEIKDGENGQDANQWHDSLDAGNDGDFAFVNGEFFKKIDGEWKELFDARPKRQNTMVTGGVSEQFVNQAINNALSDFSPGGASEVIVTITDNHSVTNETHVHALVSSEKTITFPAQVDQRVRVKNSKQSTANIILASTSTFDGETGWTIEPGNSYDVTPLGGSAYDIT